MSGDSGQCRSTPELETANRPNSFQSTCRERGVGSGDHQKDRGMIDLTSTVWTAAIAGAIMKLSCPRHLARIAHLALGWVILGAMYPF
jgi:hypothetical protein